MRWRSVSFSIPACSGQDGNTTNLKRWRSPPCPILHRNRRKAQGTDCPALCARFPPVRHCCVSAPRLSSAPEHRGKGHEMYDFAGVFRFAGRTLAATALIVAIGGAAQALYDVGPGEIPGKPGSIIRVWPLEGGGPGMGSSGGEAFRILYRSTDPSGRPIPVSGAIYIPAGPAPEGAETSSLGRIQPPASCRLAHRRSCRMSAA